MMDPPFDRDGDPRPGPNAVILAITLIGFGLAMVLA